MNTDYVVDPVFFDLESTDLNASFGRLLSSAWVRGSWEEKDRVTKKSGLTCQCKTRVVVPEPGIDCPLSDDRRCPSGWCDLPVAEATRDALEAADVIVGWNSKLFDVPMLNGRLRMHGSRPLSPVKHIDLMWKAGKGNGGIGLKSKRLAHVSEVLECLHRKTPLDPNVWRQATSGERKALELVVEHNIYDVLVTREVFGQLKPMITQITR